MLTEKVNFPEEDIIFDPNIFAVATGIEEHADYGKAFINSTKKKEMKKVHVSGGVSNFLSLFEAMIQLERQCIQFFYFMLKNGLDMGIVNSGQLSIYEDIDKDLKKCMKMFYLIEIKMLPKTSSN